MKLIFLLTLVCGVFAEDKNETLIAPGEVTIDSLDAIYTNRIAAGTAAKRRENLDFCYMNVQFIQKSQLCGCVIVRPNWVLTSARCVVDNQEGQATKVTVTIYGLRGRPAIRTTDRVVVPDGNNGLDANGDVTLNAFDAAEDIPFSTVATGNVAMIRLQTPLTSAEINGVRVKQWTPIEATDYDNFKTLYADFKYRTCGMGVINNKGTKARVLQCTDMNTISHDDCVALPATIPDEAICLKWPDRENNVCPGDYGGPVWAYKYDSTGRIINQQVFCITVGSPDIRPNSPCQGGQAIVCEFLPGNVRNWIDGIIAGR